MNLPLLALPLSDDVGRAYDDQLLKSESSGKSWMLVEFEHDKDGKWHSSLVLPLDVNRTWSSTPKTTLVARENEVPPSFDMRVGEYYGMLKFVWKLDPYDVRPLLVMRRLLISRDFDTILTVTLEPELERAYDRIGFSSDIAARFASEENFEVLQNQFQYRLGSIEYMRSDVVRAATYSALSKAFARCGHSLEKYLPEAPM